MSAMLRISLYTAETIDWIFTSLTSACLFARVLSNWKGSKIWEFSTLLVVLSFCFLIGRVVCNAYILKYGGTINDFNSQSMRNLTTADIEHYELASKLSLAARVCVTSFYWLQSSLLLLLYHRLLGHIPWVRSTIFFCWALLVLTYVSVILTTVLECRPLRLNWQISPQPITCALAYGQLLVQCVSNIVIDLVLLLIATPVLRLRGNPAHKKVQLGLLFTLGIACIVVTCIRCWNTFQVGSSQITRSFWASTQAFVATFVANAPVIYGTVRLVVQKRSGSTSTQTATAISFRNEYFVMEDRLPTSDPNDGDLQPRLDKSKAADVQHLENVASRTDDSYKMHFYS